MTRTRPHMRAPSTGRPAPPESETVRHANGWKHYRRGRPVGEVYHVISTDKYALGKDPANRRFDSLADAIAELDYQYEDAKRKEGAGA